MVKQLLRFLISFIVILSVSQTVNSKCLDCHETQPPKGKATFVDRTIISESVHAELDCGDCHDVVDNTCYNGDTCPQCNSSNWASPTGSHGEWGIIRKLQTELLISNGQRDHYKIKWDLCDAMSTKWHSRFKRTLEAVTPYLASSARLCVVKENTPYKILKELAKIEEES